MYSGLSVRSLSEEEAVQQVGDFIHGVHGDWGGEFDFISLAVAPPPLILPGAEERKEKKLRVGNRGTERSALQSPQTGNIIKDKTTHKHKYRDKDTCKYVL